MNFFLLYWERTGVRNYKKWIPSFFLCCLQWLRSSLLGWEFFNFRCDRKSHSLSWCWLTNIHLFLLSSSSVGNEHDDDDDDEWTMAVNYGMRKEMFSPLLARSEHSEQYGRHEDEWNGNERQDSSRVFSNWDECSSIEDWNSSNSLKLLKCELKKLKETIFSWKVINLIRESSDCSWKACSRTRLEGAALYGRSTPSF